MGVGAVAVVQLDVIALAEVDAQVLVIAHLDGQAVEVPLFGRVDIIFGPQLDVGARFGAGMGVDGKAGSQDRNDVLHIGHTTHRGSALDGPLLVVVIIDAVPQLNIDVGSRIGGAVGGVPALV